MAAATNSCALVGRPQPLRNAMLSSEVTNMTIGQRISDLRRKYSYSQEYVAEKLNVSRQAVSKWEQDQAAPDTYNLIALAELFHVTVEYLAVGKIEEPIPEEKQMPQSKMPMQKIIGLILLGAGLLAIILGVLFSETLILFSLWLLAGGTLCLTVRRNLPLAMLWTGIVILGSTASFLTRGWLLSFYYFLQYPREINVGMMISFVFWIALVVAIVWTVCGGISARKRKHMNSES